MWRGKIHPSSRDLSNACQKLLSSIYFKLRRLRPYIICSLDFKADFNEENELQLSSLVSPKTRSLDGFNAVFLSFVSLLEVLEIIRQSWVSDKKIFILLIKEGKIMVVFP